MANPATSFVVYSTAGRFEVLPPSAEAILGEYHEEAGVTNHGRKVYKKVQVSKRRTGPQVMLFYHDSRDGKELAGWWFGSEVGGGNVWGRAEHNSATPPQKGWKCPVDGAVCKSVVCVPKNRRDVKTERMQTADPWAEQTQEEAPEATPAAKKPRTDGSSAAASRLVMTRKGNRTDMPEAALGLFGEYMEQGWNHGKKTYKKKTDPDETSVWMYYWDERDGKDFSGWWLGESVGSSEVFARGPQHGQQPPVRGWQIPHNVPPRSDVVVLPAGHEEELEMGEEDRLEKMRNSLSSAEEAAEKGIAMAKKVLNGPSCNLEDAVRAVYEQLLAQTEKMTDARDSLARHSKASKRGGKSSSGTEAEVSLLQERAETLVGRLETELEVAKGVLESVEQEGAEENDGREIEETLPLLMEQVALAEVAAEKATTDEGAARAQKKVDEARQETQRALDKAKRYAPEAQKLATKEFAELKSRCEEAGQRLSAWHGSESGGLSLDPDARPAPQAGEDDDDEDAVDAATELDLSMPEDELVESAQKRCEGVESKARNALQTAEVVLEDLSDDLKAVNGVVEHVDAERAASRTLKSTLMRELKALKQKKPSTSTTQSYNSMISRLGSIVTKLTNKYSTAKQLLSKSKKTSSHEQESRMLMKSLMADIKAAVQAADSLETEYGESEWRNTQMNLGAALEGGTGDLMRDAVADTQVAADKATASIGIARSGLTAQQNKASQLPDEDARQAAMDELAPLLQELELAGTKVAPFKTARADFEAKVKVKTEVAELTERFDDAEAELVRIEELFEDAEEASVESAEAAVPGLLARLGRAAKALDRRAAESEGSLIKEALNELGTRGQALAKRAEKLLGRASTCRKSLASKALVHAVASEMDKVEEIAAQVEELQRPWKQTTVEILPDALAQPNFEEAEQLARSSESVIQQARMSVMEKLIEARALGGVAAKAAATSELNKLKARVDEVGLSLTQLQVDTARRRISSRFSHEAELVTVVEQAANNALEGAAALSEDVMDQPVSEKVKAACKTAIATVAPALKDVEAAKKALAARYAEQQVRASPSQRSIVMELERRLKAAEKRLLDLSSGAKDFEKGKKVLADQRKSLKSLEAKIAGLELSTIPLGDERPTGPAELKMAKDVTAAEESVKQWVTHAESLTTPGALRIAVERVAQGVPAIRRRLEAVKSDTAPRRGQALAGTFVEEGKQRLAKVEQAMKKADDAAGPFLTGLEVSESAGSRDAIAACETAAAAVKEMLTDTNNWLGSRRGEVAGLLGFETLDEEVDDAMTRNFAAAKELQVKLSQYNRDTAARKRLASGEHFDAPKGKMHRMA